MSAPFDYYMLCETGLKTILLTLTAYFPNTWQIMNGDESGLVGGADYFARLHPGSFGPTAVANRQVAIDWEIELKIYVLFKELQTSWDNFRSLRSEVSYLILQYPSLNNVQGVQSVTIGAGENPVYIVDDPEIANPTPLYISQTFSVLVHQLFPMNGGEYA